MESALRTHLPDGKFNGVSARRSKSMAAVRGKQNKTTETKVRFALVRAGVRGWHMHSIGLPGHPDFYFPKQRIAVFTDGCFWHGCLMCGHIPKVNSGFWAEKIKRNHLRDQKTNRRLKGMGIRVIRFWEHEIQGHSDRCIQRISSELSRRTRLGKRTVA